MIRLAGLVAGFSAAVGICLLIGRHAPPRILSEHEGEIRTIEIHYTRGSAPTTWPVIRTLLEQLSPRVRLIVACGDADDAAAFRKTSRDIPQTTIRVVVVGAPITGWSKDRFLVRSGRPTVLLRPLPDPSALPGRNADAEVAPAIARNLPLEFTTETAPLAYDAGDLLAVGQRVLVDDELRSKNPLAPDWEGEVGAMTGLRPLYLGGAPRHHIGMFATPLDGRTVLVADPDLGKRLWTDAATRALGRPDWTDSAIQPFRNAIRDLQSAGFTVVRAPAAIMGPKVYVTYTNAVLETRDGRKIVYMPSYGVATLDAEGTKAFESQGYTVVPIPVAGVFRLCGTIGCLVNVVERD